jgi:GNAT superfamily N-acetyltransferase
VIRIRPVGVDEWRGVRDLRLRALADAPDAFGSSLERERGAGEAEWHAWITGWEGAENRMFVALDGYSWVGMAVGSIAPSECVAHLYAMWVDPSVRRGGVGARLVEEVSAWAAAAGATELELGVTQTNAAARRLYEACGFADTGSRHPLREGAPIQVIVMRRALRPDGEG